MHNRIQYNIIFDSKSIDKTNSQIKGAAFDEFDTEWGLVCSGNMDHINSTSMGKRSWSYDFEIPIGFQCPPKQLAILRLTFKYNKKKVIKKESRGSTPALAQLGIMKDIHELTLYENAKILCTIPVGKEFLEFIANNEPTDRDKKDQRATGGLAQAGAWLVRKFVRIFNH